MALKYWIFNLDRFIYILTLYFIIIHSCNCQSKTKTGNVRKGEEKGCKIPPTPEHGRLEYLEDNNFQVQYYCDEGFELIGVHERHCLEDGTWTAETPSCKKVVKCGYPGKNQNCKTNVTDYFSEPGTVVSYHCDEDFFLFGPSVRTCNEDGRWVPEMLPFCEVNVVQNRRVSDVSDNVNRAAAFRIIDGYVDKCSFAEDTNEVNTYWTIDLLEVQEVHIIILLFGDFSESKVDLKYGLDEQLHPLTLNDYKITQVSRKTQLGESKTMQMTLQEPKKMKYLNIEVPFIPYSRGFKLCEVKMFSKSAIPKEMCHSNLDGDSSGVTVNLLNNICYTFEHVIKDSWSGSNVECNALNGSLTSALNAETNSFLKDNLRARYRGKSEKPTYWIGGHKEASKTDEKVPESHNGMFGWMWTNNHPFEFSDWGHDQPSNDGHSNCLSLTSELDWKWDDANCDKLANFICEHGILRCSSPDHEDNVMIVDEMTLSRDIGSKIVYQCSENYILEGKAERVCEKSGQWSGTSPKCKDKGTPQTHEEKPEKPEKQTSGLKAGAIVAIVLGSVAFVIIIIIAIVCLVERKKHTGSKSMKYSRKSESAEVLDVSSDKGHTNYSSAEQEDFSK